MLGPQQQFFAIRNFDGGMNTVSSVDDINPGFDGPAECLFMENLKITKRGQLVSEDGLINLNNEMVVTNGIFQGIYRFKTGAINQLLCMVDGTLYKLDSNFNETVVSSVFATTGPVHFETAYAQCIICDGVNPPWTYDGTTVSALGGSPPSGARASLFYLDRLHIFSATANQSLLYYSNAGHISNGYASNFVNCNVNDGQKITAIARYFIPGQLDPVIVVGKEGSVGIVTGDATGSNPYTFNVINQDTGIINFRCIVQAGPDMFYLTQRGVTSLRTDNQLNGLQQAYISSKIEDQFDKLELSQVEEKAFCVYDFRNYRIRFFVPERGYTNNSAVYNLDVNLGTWNKTTYVNMSNQNVRAAFIDQDGTQFLNYDIFLMKTTAQSTFITFAGSETSPIPYTWTSGFMDFGLPNVYKRIIDMNILAKTSNAPITLNAIYDYGGVAGEPVDLAPLGPSKVWGGGVWTASASTYSWAGESNQFTKHSPYNYFKNIQFSFTVTPQNDVPIEIYMIQFVVEFEEYR